jgi:glycosyltransferase involved in cell wall biosynthesis
MSSSSKRLLLVGSTRQDVHLRNYYSLIDGYFDDVLLVSGNHVDFCETKVLDFGLKNPLTIRKTIKQLRKIIEEFQPSIIHVHQANTFGYVTSKANKGKVPQVLTIWGSDILLLPQKSPLHKRMVKTALKGSDIITADASFIEEKVNDLVGSSNFTTANFGIDLPAIDLESSKKEQIIYSNRLHDDLYNIDAIIEGFSLFRANQSESNWKLVIAGKGKNTAALKDLAKEKLKPESYEFVGFVDYDTNMTYYQRSSIYISIPSSDGTSVSLLEAMACGCVPIVSNLPANHEWIESGKNGIIYDSILLEAIQEAINLDSRSVAIENQKIIQKKATKKANSEIFKGLYDSLIT